MGKNLVDITHVGDESFSPSSYKNNVFRKEFSPDSYNPFLLNNKDSLNHFPEKAELLVHPIIFISNHLEAYPSNYRDSSFRVEKNAVLLSENFLEKFSKQTNDSLQSEISIQQFNPNEISLLTKSSGQAVITLLQNYYLGWKATVDDKPAPIEISNYSTMSLALPEGSHRVMFVYDPRVLRWLLWTSIVSQLLLLIFLFATRKKSYHLNQSE